MRDLSEGKSWKDMKSKNANLPKRKKRFSLDFKGQVRFFFGGKMQRGLSGGVVQERLFFVSVCGRASSTSPQQ